MIKLFKEPLLVFLLFALGLFALYQQSSDSAFLTDEPLDKIVVTTGKIAALSLNFEKIWQRSPSQDELDGLIQRYIR